VHAGGRPKGRGFVATALHPPAPGSNLSVGVDGAAWFHHQVAMTMITNDPPGSDCHRALASVIDA